MITKILQDKFFINDGIFTKDTNDQDFTKEVEDFYSIGPFPNYHKNDNKLSINAIGFKNIAARKLKSEIGLNKKILEVGSGTSQLAIYFALGTNNQVVAMDSTLESLKLGRNFAHNNNINNISFVKSDLFDNTFVENTFDMVWCSGVLHHTKNPRKGFKNIIRYGKKNSYIIIGLYNFYGRFWTILRQKIFRIIGLKYGYKFVKFFDPYLRAIKNNPENDEKVFSWIRDQYEHPHESLHTMDEVLRWFKEENIEFINSIPNCQFEDNDYNLILKKKKIGTFYQRFFNQIFMLFNNFGKEGGLFLVIGKKIK